MKIAFGRSPLTQKNVAERLDIREGTVSDWVKHGKIPEGWHLLRLPVILRCDGHWLLTGGGSPDRSPHAERALEIVRHVSTTTDEDDLNQILGFIAQDPDDDPEDDDPDDPE